MVEGAALEKRYTGNGIVGSNPTLSASNYKKAPQHPCFGALVLHDPVRRCGLLRAAGIGRCGNEGTELDWRDEGEADATLIVAVATGMNGDPAGRITETQLKLVTVVWWISEEGGGHEAGTPFHDCYLCIMEPSPS